MRFQAAALFPQPIFAASSSGKNMRMIREQKMLFSPMVFEGKREKQFRNESIPSWKAKVSPEKRQSEEKLLDFC